MRTSHRLRVEDHFLSVVRRRPPNRCITPSAGIDPITPRLRLRPILFGMLMRVWFWHPSLFHMKQSELLHFLTHNSHPSNLMPSNGGNTRSVLA